jgi:hypothetical protein
MEVRLAFYSAGEIKIRQDYQEKEFRLPSQSTFIYEYFFPPLAPSTRIAPSFSQFTLTDSSKKIRYRSGFCHSTGFLRLSILLLVIIRLQTTFLCLTSLSPILPYYLCTSFLNDIPHNHQTHIFFPLSTLCRISSIF